MQSVLSLVTLPVIAAWGLPFSLLTFIGNFIFNPILSLFLGLATIIFVTELLHIPNGLVYFCLEKVGALWLWGLSWGSDSVLTPLVSYATIISIFIIGMTLVIMHSTYLSYAQATTALGMFLALALGGAHFFGARDAYECISCGNARVEMKVQNGIITITDHGGRGPFAPMWIRGDLLPHLARRCAQRKIDCYRFTKKGKSARMRAEMVLQKNIARRIEKF